MPKLVHRLPAYRQHKSTGQAIVTFNGRDFYLGPWKSAASRAEYNRLTTEWLASGGALMPGMRAPRELCNLRWGLVPSWAKDARSASNAARRTPMRWLAES
jgi:hypothetical protein